MSTNEKTSVGYFLKAIALISIIFLLCLCGYLLYLASSFLFYGETIVYSGYKIDGYKSFTIKKASLPIRLIRDLTKPDMFYTDDLLYPKISPDGEYIAFYRSIGPSRGDLVIIDINGKNEKILLREADFDNFSWSPDSATIISGYCPDRCTYSNKREIKNIRIDNGHIIFTVPGQNPDYSPDGSRILFIGSGDDDTVYIIESNGSNIRSLNVTAKYASWSHDGKKIALLQENTIRIITSEGSPVLKINERAETWFNPARWSPNDSYLLVAGDYLRIFNVTTGEIFDTLTARSRYVTGAWSPDSKQVIYSNSINKLMIYHLSGKWNQDLRIDGVTPDWLP
jgi:Tol biopolymer transport system component